MTNWSSNPVASRPWSGPLPAGRSLTEKIPSPKNCPAYLRAKNLFGRSGRFWSLYALDRVLKRNPETQKKIQINCINIKLNEK
jgi:hypothetical protein